MTPPEDVGFGFDVRLARLVVSLLAGFIAGMLIAVYGPGGVIVKLVLALVVGAAIGAVIGRLIR